jgi:Uncharacterised nucleotidyltransferase
MMDRGYLMTTARYSQAHLIAAMLWRTWDNDPSPFQITAQELAGITPQLVSAGAGGLSWRRVRYLESQPSQSASMLHQTYRYNTLQSAIHERDLIQLISFLRSTHLDPLLGKGWSAARYYPEPGLRPYGDFDLYFRPEQYAAAKIVRQSAKVESYPVDIHCGAPELSDRDFDEIYQRSHLVGLGEVQVRIFGPEDHLRLLCIHLLRHGAWRPLWLCDLGAAIESRPLDFDWDYFLSGSPKRTAWVICALGLAHHLLGARLGDTPIAKRARRLPHWLVPSVLQRWEKLPKPDRWQSPGPTMVTYLRHSKGVFEALRRRWPTPIEATVYMNGAFNGWPRLPYQIGAGLFRTGRFVTKLPKLFTDSGREPGH